MFSLTMVTGFVSLVALVLLFFFSQTTCTSFPLLSLCLSFSIWVSSEGTGNKAFFKAVSKCRGQFCHYCAGNLRRHKRSETNYVLVVSQSTNSLALKRNACLSTSFFSFSRSSFLFSLQSSPFLMLCWNLLSLTLWSSVGRGEISWQPPTDRQTVIERQTESDSHRQWWPKKKHCLFEESHLWVWIAFLACTTFCCQSYQLVGHLSRSSFIRDVIHARMRYRGGWQGKLEKKNQFSRYLPIQKEYMFQCKFPRS